MLNHLTLEQKLSITKQFVGIIKEWATPTLPDLTINLKQCSVQPRRLKDPESTVWISWFPASRLDPTGGARLKHVPQILWKQNRDVFFLTPSCLKLAIKHPSLSTFSVCQSGADQENHSLLQNQVKFSWAPQRYRHIFILSHQSWIQTVKPCPERDPASAEPFTWGKCSWVQEERDTWDVTGRAERKSQCWFCCAPQHLMQFSHTCGKKLMLLFI